MKGLKNMRYLCIILVMSLNVYGSQISRVVSDSIEMDANLNKALSSNIKEMRGLGNAGNFEGAKQKAVELEQIWFGKDGIYYGFMVKEIAGTLNSSYFGLSNVKEQNKLATQYALKALDWSFRQDEMKRIPLDIELSLLGFINWWIDAKDSEKKDQWPQKRKDYAKYFFNVLSRFEKYIDPYWDPNEQKISFPMPPKGIKGAWGYGMSPENIEDPNLRAEYESAIKVFAEKARYYSFQTFLRREKKSTVQRLENYYLIQMYSEPILDENELQKDIDNNVSDDNIRKRISFDLQEKIKEFKSLNQKKTISDPNIPK